VSLYAAQCFHQHFENAARQRARDRWMPGWVHATLTVYISLFERNVLTDTMGMIVPSLRQEGPGDEKSVGLSLSVVPVGLIVLVMLFRSCSSSGCLR
jgi:hypothetical protein